MFAPIRPKAGALALLGSAILAFGLYHIHSFSGITEGGSLGLTLLLHHWFDVSPAVSAFVFNIAFYAFGLKVLGRDFIAYSIIAGLGFSAFYALFEQFDPIWPGLVNHPLLAAIAGALFVGVGAGLCVRMGGAPCADDALAMSLSKLTRLKIQWIYLISDVVVLGLSASYIPWNRLAYSLLSVVLSGQLVGLMQRLHWPHKPAAAQRIEMPETGDQGPISDSAALERGAQCCVSESADTESGEQK